MPTRSAAIEKAARDKGFRDSDSMLDFERRRQEALRAHNTVSESTPTKPKAAQPPVNTGGIAGWLNHVTDALNGANKK